MGDASAALSALDEAVGETKAGYAADVLEEAVRKSRTSKMAPPPEADGGKEEGSAVERPRASLEDFELGKTLGRGSFGTVAMATHKATGKVYAMKSLSKRMLIAVKQTKTAMLERELLRRPSHPFIVRLYFAFSSAECLHLVLDLMPGGDLWGRLEAEGKMPLSRVRLYGAELVLALGHVHDVLQVVFRDMKPDNVLLDAQGHACLADFGLATSSTTGKSFCGTVEYIAPEVVERKEYNKAVDWWGLGAVLYELLVGKSPFADRNPNLVQKHIMQRALAWPDGTDAAVQETIGGLMARDADARIGAGPTGTKDVMASSMWKPLDFAKVLQRGYTPEWVPPAPGSGEEAGAEASSSKQAADEDAEWDEDVDEESLGPLPVMTEEDEMEFRAMGLSMEEKPHMFKGFSMIRGESLDAEALEWKAKGSVPLDGARRRNSSVVWLLKEPGYESERDSRKD